MQRLKRLALIMITLGILAGSLFFTSGPAHAQTRAAHTASWTICKTLNLTDSWGFVAIRPQMTVPVCYNGSSIWQNGGVTPGVNTLGFALDGISWAGTYNSGGSWIGVGENYTVTAWFGWESVSCAARWFIDDWGNLGNHWAC